MAVSFELPKWAGPRRRWANLVFGHLVEQRTNKRTLEKDFVYAPRPEGPNRQFVRMPFYSGSMGASILVEVELQKRAGSVYDRKDVRLVRCA